jgi:hypothetical protein
LTQDILVYPYKNKGLDDVPAICLAAANNNGWRVKHIQRRWWLEAQRFCQWYKQISSAMSVILAPFLSRQYELRSSLRNAASPNSSNRHGTP